MVVKGFNAFVVENLTIYPKLDEDSVGFVVSHEVIKTVSLANLYVHHNVFDSANKIHFEFENLAQSLIIRGVIF